MDTGKSEELLVTEGVSAKDLERIAELRPIDDDFMRCIFKDNKPLAENVLRTFLGKPELKVETLETQRDLIRLAGSRSLELDVYCIDTEGIRYDMEVQRSSSGAGKKRIRYHSSAMDIENLKAGEKFRRLRETHTIFITEKDVLAGGLPLYHVERICLETGKAWKSGGHILYVNGANREDTELGRLMMDFQNPDPDTMHNPLMREAAGYYKKTQEGVKKMCEIFDEIRREGIAIGEKRGEKRGKKRGEKRGRKIGEKAGEEKGVKRFSALIQKLTPGSEDYKLALNADRSQREALYAKYGIG